MKRIVLMALSCLIVIILALVSCGPAVVEEEEGETVVGKTVEKEAPAVEKEQKVVEKEEEEEKGPIYGGVLNWIWGLTAHGWDPTLCDYTTDYYTTFYWERMGYADLARGPSGTGEFEYFNGSLVSEDSVTGCLAEGYEQTDSTHVTFYLKKGIHWQNAPPLNGREFTADDVVYALTRQAESPRSGGRWEWVESFEAVDKYTVLMTLKRPHGNWPYRVYWGAHCQIYPPEVVEAGIDDWRNHVGTGPFILKDVVEGSSTTYVRNPEYWQRYSYEEKEYQIPFVDRINIMVVPDASTRIAALRTGKVDVLGGVEFEYVESLAATNPELGKYKYPGGAPLCIYFEPGNEKFADFRVRKALSMAVDRQYYIDAIFGGEGFLLETHINSFQGESLYTPIEKMAPENRETFEYNPEKAKQYLAEAGYPNGFKTKLMVKAGLEDHAAVIISYWAEIGVDTEIEVLESANLYSRQYAHDFTDMISNQQGASSPMGDLMQIQVREHNWNPSEWQDPKYIADYEDMAATIDLQERLAKMKKMFEYALGTCGAEISFPTGAYTTYWHPWVKNYNGEAYVGYLNGAPIYARLWIDQDVKKR